MSNKHGKKYREVVKELEKGKVYDLEEALQLLEKVSYTKFDPTVEVAIKTSANPKYNNQMIRGTVVLPHGVGKSRKIAVLVNDERAEEAKKAGADFVGYEEVLDMIKNDKLDFDVLITVPELIRELAPYAKKLGPKGLMPSPKTGTLTSDIKKSVEEVKKGKVEFKLDKTGNIHAGVGKLSFGVEKLKENIETLLKAIKDSKPEGVKGKLFRKIVLSTTMSPGIQIDEKKYND